MSQKTIQVTSVQDLDPRPSVDSDHVSVLRFEMTVFESGENPTHTLTWKPSSFLRHIKRRTNDDRFGSFPSFTFGVLVGDNL